MKKLVYLFLILLLVGCTPDPIKVEVWTPPKITVPEKPKLISDGKGTQGEISRKLSSDLIQMRNYCSQLENIVNTLTTPQDGNINK